MSISDRLVLGNEILNEPSVENAISVLDGYRGIEDPLRVGVDSALLAADFLPTSHPNLYAIALLGNLALNDDKLSATPRAVALKRYFGSPHLTDTSSGFVSCVLADMISLKNESTSDPLIVADDPRVKGILRQSDSSRLRLPPQLLSERIGFASPHHMMVLLDSHNVESFLISAIHGAAQLRSKPVGPREGINDIQAYKDIHAIEALFAPICEVLGYDALAMFVRSVARMQKLEMLGGLSAECLMWAKQAQEKYGATDGTTTERIVRQAIETVLGKNYHNRPVVTDNSGHGIRVGEFVADLHGSTIRGVWRTKSTGSLAEKYFKEGKEPADIYGVTLIVQNDDEVAKLLPEVAKKVRDKKNMIFNSSAKRPGQYCKVQGTEKYITHIINDRLTEALGDDHVQSVVEIEQVDADGFHVSKVTFRMITTVKGSKVSIPFEIQIQTESQRQDSQIGNTSHAVREAKKRGVDIRANPDLLALIKMERGGSLTLGTQLHPASVFRGAKYHTQLSRVPDPGANHKAYGRAPRRASGTD